MRQPFLNKLPPAVKNHSDRSRIRKSFDFELLTPMIGGDSASWEPNPDAPVRATAIKGQLRFWWRTMQAETDIKALLKRENLLWGGEISNSERIQSKVKLSVTNQTRIRYNEVRLNQRGSGLEDNSVPTYVCFPLLSAHNDARTPSSVGIIESLSFTLNISFPVKSEKEVVKTLTLWALFGGVGARTRRGCGSVYCEELMASFEDEKAICQFIEKCSCPGPEMDYPRLDGGVLAARSCGDDPLSAWQKLIKSYAEFRQDRTGAGSHHPGRSYWPEPDAIRRLIGTQSTGTNHCPVHPDGIWFPRAAYGLPIITKFKPGAGDPQGQFELTPVRNKRWPSPVILKVIRLGNGIILKTALVLNQAFPNGLALSWNGRTYTVPDGAGTRKMVQTGKVLRNGGKGPIRPGETLYQVLFRSLNLEEIT